MEARYKQQFPEPQYQTEPVYQQQAPYATEPVYQEPAYPAEAYDQNALYQAQQPYQEAAPQMEQTGWGPAYPTEQPWETESAAPAAYEQPYQGYAPAPEQAAFAAETQAWEPTVIEQRADLQPLYHDPLEEGYAPYPEQPLYQEQEFAPEPQFQAQAAFEPMQEQPIYQEQPTYQEPAFAPGPQFPAQAAFEPGLEQPVYQEQQQYYQDAPAARPPAAPEPRYANQAAFKQVQAPQAAYQNQPARPAQAAPAQPAYQAPPQQQQRGQSAPQTQYQQQARREAQPAYQAPPQPRQAASQQQSQPVVQQQRPPQAMAQQQQVARAPQAQPAPMQPAAQPQAARAPQAQPNQQPQQAPPLRPVQPQVIQPQPAPQPQAAGQVRELKREPKLEQKAWFNPAPYQEVGPEQWLTKPRKAPEPLQTEQTRGETISLQQKSPMKVALLAYTPEPEKVVAAAARLCYSPKGGVEIMDNFTDDQVEGFLNRLSAQGHFSPFEHAVFTFAVDGVSRSLSHQLVRHRIASYSQKSQRYVIEKGFEYVTPPTIARNKEYKRAFNGLMRRIEQLYTEYTAAGVEPEDARAILPNAATTNLVITMNARSLHNFFRLRCCNRSQWEIRMLANQMLAKVKCVAPNLFANAGPSCLTEGVCYEGEMSCGKMDVQVRQGQA